MSDLQGPVPGADLRAQAVALAGVLAEHGVDALVLAVPGEPPETLHARRTDLPGRIVDAAARSPGATLHCPGLGLTITLAPGGLHVQQSRDRRGAGGVPGRPP